MEHFRSIPATRLLKSSSLLLILIGSFSLGLYVLSRRASSSSDMHWFLKLVLVQVILFIASAWIILRAKPERSIILIVLVFAGLFRLSLLFAPPYLSDDIYRYIWDGRVQAAGINPYRYIPADPALAHLRDDQIYPRINRRESAHTMYPPVAEAVWFLTTRLSESVTWMKTTMILFEGLAIWGIVQLLASFELPRQRVLLYAWHPLTVWEFAGSGHLDAIAIAFIVLALFARRKNTEVWSSLAIGCATLIKLFPMVIVPALYKRGSWKMPLVFALTIALAYLPYLGVGAVGVIGYLPGYARERGILSGEQFFLLSAVRRLLPSLHIPTSAFVAFAVFILGGLVFLIWRRNRDEDVVVNSLIIATAFSVLVSPHFPWYFAWLVPFICVVPSIPVIYLTLSGFLLYLTWNYSTDDQVFKIKAAIFIPFFLLLASSLWKGRDKLKLKTSLG